MRAGRDSGLFGLGNQVPEGKNIREPGPSRGRLSRSTGCASRLGRPAFRPTGKELYFGCSRSPAIAFHGREYRAAGEDLCSYLSNEGLSRDQRKEALKKLIEVCERLEEWYSAESLYEIAISLYAHDEELLEG